MTRICYNRYTGFEYEQTIMYGSDEYESKKK